MQPIGGFLQRRGDQAPRPPLRLSSLLDQAGAFENAQVLGDRGRAHLERQGDVLDDRIAGREASQDGAPSRIGQGGEGEGERVARH